MSARSAAVEAIRSLEQRLVEALGGESLRGLPNLAPRGPEFYAARVNAFSRHGSGGHLPKDGRSVLVLGRDGRLLVASWNVENFVRRGDFVEARPVRDDELIAEDAEAFSRLVTEVLEKHIALAERRTEALVRAEDLAQKIIGAIGLVVR